jgi:hypothetical protein
MAIRFWLPVREYGRKRGLASAALGGYRFGNPTEEAIDVGSSASDKTWVVLGTSKSHLVG